MEKLNYFVSNTDDLIVLEIEEFNGQVYVKNVIRDDDGFFKIQKKKNNAINIKMEIVLHSPNQIIRAIFDPSQDSLSQ